VLYLYFHSDLLNIKINIYIAIFREYLIDIVQKSNKWYRSITRRESMDVYF